MKFSFFNPVKIYFERNCVTNHKEVFTACGKRALIITGRSSARRCGALDDVERVLKECGIEYFIYDKIESNPSMESVAEASVFAKKKGVDFVIGIGGGSPVDASKAIAVLGANELQVEDLFTNQFDSALPVIAIPTTSGTGSEATPYSVLLSKEKETKLSFGNDKTFPTYALLDSKYTFSLEEDFIISTAVDAFTHVFEGYVANRSTTLSEQLAIEGIRKFGECLPAMLSGNFNEEVRDKLMYVSLLGGMVITLTGVTIAHGMGYCYTYFKGIPHGRANGLLMREYIRYIHTAVKDKIDNSMELMGCTDTEDYLGKLKELIGTAPALTDEEVDRYTKLTLMQKGSIVNTANALDENGIHQLWENMK